MRIALISLDQVWEDKEKNRLQCEHFIGRAATDGAEVAVFPEMTLTGFSMDVAKTGEPGEHLQSLQWFQQIAQKASIALVVGYVQKAEDGRGLNRTALIDADGSVLSSYTKLHPFSYAGEDRYIASGDALAYCQFHEAVVGLTICYDLRFGGLYRNLGDRCDIIFVIANWPSSRTTHWDVLLQARAIEHQLFMVGVNRTGVAPGGLTYDQSSAIYSPLGERVVPVVSDGVYALYDVDISQVATARKTMPVRQDRWDEYPQ